MATGSLKENRVPGHQSPILVERKGQRSEPAAADVVEIEGQVISLPR